MRVSRRWCSKRWCIMFGIILLCSGLRAPAQVLSNEANLDPIVCQLRTIREAGRLRDQSQVAQLLDNLIHPRAGALGTVKVDFGYTAPFAYHLQIASLVALARIGNASSLPVLEKLRGESCCKSLPYLEPTIARIKVELAHPSSKSQEAWSKKVQQFIELSGLSLDELTQGTSPKARACLLYLAEMAAHAYEQGYHQAFKDLVSWGIRLETDFRANLIMQLAYHTLEQRVEWLMSHLKAFNTTTHHTDYVIQALADCGDAGLKAVLRWLEELCQTECADRRSFEVPLRNCLLALCAFDKPEAQNAVQNALSRHSLPDVLDVFKINCPYVFASDF